MEEPRLEIERCLFHKHARTFVVAWGRVDAALHTLLGRVPDPTDPKDIEVLEIALQLIREEDAELADYHERRWRVHALRQLQGGTSPAG